MPRLTNGSRPLHVQTTGPFATKDSGYEPLLSEAELDALMGNESTDFGAQERQSSQRDEEEIDE
jgi:hypothetical protein